MSIAKFLMAAALMLVATLSQAVEVVGKVGYMSGSLLAQRADGTVKVMGLKSEVLAGDALVTALNSYAQIQMNDGMKMTLRPNSHLKIDEYQFNRQEPKSDNAVFSLLKGGLRTMTGLIGKRGDPDAYKLHTATATIGIRGTDFSSRLCATPNCQDDAAASVRGAGKSQTALLPAAGGVTPPTAPTASPPGLYVTVHTGQVVMAQADKMLNLGRGETGFASTAALVRLPEPPAFMNADMKQTGAIEAKASKADKEKADTKPEDEKKDSKQDKEKIDSKSEGEKDSGKQEDGGKPDTAKESITPEGADAGGSAEPSINQGGCVVQ